MSYRNFNELKQLPKDEAKNLYNKAYSRFKTVEKDKYFKLLLLTSSVAGIGAGIGFYFSNETHLGIYLAAIGAVIGQYLMTKLIEKRMSPYIKEEMDEFYT